MWPWLGAVADFFGRFNVVDELFVFIFAIFWLWILKRNAERQDTYDLGDNLKDPFTNRASAVPLVYLSLAFLAIWWAIRLGTNGGDPSSFILTVLGIFVVKAGADHAISAWGTRTPDKLVPPPDCGDAPQVTTEAGDPPDRDRGERHGS